MNKKTIERPLLILCGFASLVELLDVWWSAYVLIISFSTLSFFYMALSILTDNEKINAQSLKNIFNKGHRLKSLLNLLGGICLAYLVTGILAKVEIWYWANNALQVCLVFGIVLLVPALIKKNRWLSARLILFLGVTGILYFISNEAIIEFKYRGKLERKKAVYEHLKRLKKDWS